MTARVQRYREIEASRVAEFLRLGHPKRHFFPHRVYYLPKCGPDGYKLATRMCGPCRPDENWEVLVYAAPDLAAAFPSELFFDDDLVWHQQQFGRPGLVATANLLWRDDTLHAMVLQSDIVQRASRRSEHRTQIQNRFKGWPRMLLNAILGFALEHDIRTLYVPRASFALRHTDPKRRVGPALFERVYDATVQAGCDATPDEQWWRISVPGNAARVVRADAASERVTSGRTICVCHDIERGLGHLEVDSALAARAAERGAARLAAMLEDEAALGVRGTYHVVGELLATVREPIAAGGHAVAFHSYNHRVESEPQLPRCRQIDYRIKGYRPPQSRITPELTDEDLCFHNFEWLASSRSSFGFGAPRLENGLAKLPIAFDDFGMYRGDVAFDEWVRRVTDGIDDAEFFAVSLHDCYADLWLPRYRELLGRLRPLGTLKTFDDVAAELVLASAV
jgi:hypothetical protein